METSCGDAAAKKAGQAEVWKMVTAETNSADKKNEIATFVIVQLQD